ncbi:PfkB family carbohydrate kinase [uncultured Propionibacterium sp.]|uniref:PfkB family carbohydrate kinase n=1 Tax=uncultured Propionibacterium sp. TaxID=218066 RepID=UPI00292FBEF9|nr:PfkB family carbohydrate kinase [uncultured Propionibacterium sp.]
MTRAGRVISLESIIVDLRVDVPELPRIGGDVIASGSRVQVGGGFNVVAAAARQGVPTVYAGRIGSGPYGRLVAEALTGEGVTVGGPTDPDEDSGYCVAFHVPGSDPTYVTVPGAEGRLRPEDLAGLGPGAGDVLCVSGYDLMYEVSGPTITGWLGDHGAGPRVVLDPGPLVLDIPTPAMGAAVGVLDVLTLSAREALLVAGAEPSGGELHHSVRRRLGLRDATVLVIRAGDEGCTATGGELRGLVPVPADVVDAVDVTGAGDTHTGVLAARLAEGSDFGRALTAANEAAALSVTVRGPATAPARSDMRNAAID